MAVLILGDTHIPERAEWLRKELVDFFESESFDLVVLTGDLTSKSVLNYFEKLGKVFAVRGNMDHLKLPDYCEFKVFGFKVGVVHGHQVYPRGNREMLSEIAKEKGVDILLSGHTHAVDVYFGEKILLNPGSATGAWGGGGGSLKPSFMILKQNCVEVYELDKDLVRVVYRLSR